MVTFMAIVLIATAVRYLGYMRFTSERLEPGPSPTRTKTDVPPPLPSPAQPATTLISKSTGVDYTRLHDLLAEGKWKEADQETSRAMLQAAGREEEGWLRTEDIDNFSCEDLRIIDQLWLESSQGKFGFSVQKDIYLSLGGTREINGEVWANFGDQVGWTKENGDWLGVKDLTYSINAQPGNLPFAGGWGMLRGIEEGGQLLLSTEGGQSMVVGFASASGTITVTDQEGNYMDVLNLRKFSSLALSDCL